MNRKYYSNLFNLKGLGQFKSNPVLFTVTYIKKYILLHTNNFNTYNIYYIPISSILTSFPCLMSVILYIIWIKRSYTRIANKK